VIEETCRRILDLVQPPPEVEDALRGFALAMADRGFAVAGYALEGGACTVTFADDARRYRVPLARMPDLVARIEAGLPPCLDLLAVPEGEP